MATDWQFTGSSGHTWSSSTPEEVTFRYNAEFDEDACGEGHVYRDIEPGILSFDAVGSFGWASRSIDILVAGNVVKQFTPADGQTFEESVTIPIQGSGTVELRIYHKDDSKPTCSYPDHTNSITITNLSVIPAPTISSISWSPTGDYTTIAAGAALVESVVGSGTTQLMLVAVDPAAVVDPAIENGEAILQIDQEDPFIVAAGDHFRFNNKEWWALNIICGPECSMITLADEVAQFEKIPKIGDEIQFAANIDWHDQEMSSIKWYYAKAPGVCFSDIWDLDWEEFAVGEDTSMPAHTFDTEGDEETTFFMVTATNMDFGTGTLNTLCGPIFNLWKPAPPGFMEGWLVAAFMAFILPALAEKTEYFADLVFDGDTDPDTPSGGFSLLWAPVTFVVWIAEAAAAVAEDMWDIIFGEPEDEDAGGYGLLWTAAEFVAWLYRSIAAMVEDILDLVFGED